MLRLKGDLVTEWYLPHNYRSPKIMKKVAWSTNQLLMTIIDKLLVFKFCRNVDMLSTLPFSKDLTFSVFSGNMNLYIFSLLPSDQSFLPVFLNLKWFFSRSLTLFGLADGKAWEKWNELAWSSAPRSYLINEWLEYFCNLFNQNNCVRKGEELKSSLRWYMLGIIIRLWVVLREIA